MGKPFRWECTEDGRDSAVTVDAWVLTPDPELNVRLAMAGIARGSATLKRFS